jgi:hypothetical protein
VINPGDEALFPPYCGPTRYAIIAGKPAIVQAGIE